MHELQAGSARVVIDDRDGGRLRRLAVGGFDLLVPPEVDERNQGAFPMAPWAGRIRHGQFAFDGHSYTLPLNKPPHAIHGTVRDHRWTVQESSDHLLVLRTELGEPWPFGGHVVQRISLSPDGLGLIMEVHADRRSMPVSCGWHPWWSRELYRGEPLEIELHAGSMYHRDDEDIPDGELVDVAPPPWDDCFTDLGEPAAVLRWPGAATVVIETDCPCVVVYTEPEHAMCVEPQSGPPDQFNLDPVVVEPGAPLVVSTTWRWQLES